MEKAIKLPGTGLPDGHFIVNYHYRFTVSRKEVSGTFGIRVTVALENVPANAIQQALPDSRVVRMKVLVTLGASHNILVTDGVRLSLVRYFCSVGIFYSLCPLGEIPAKVIIDL